MNDQKFLMWLHEQLTEKHGWNPLVGHLHTLRAIIYNTPSDQYSPAGLALNDLEELKSAIKRKDGMKVNSACPDCESVYVDTTWINHSFPYGRGDSAVKLTVRVPARKCLGCGEKWLDYVAENLMQEKVNSHIREKL